jgi:hypothetical protein
VAFLASIFSLSLSHTLAYFSGPVREASDVVVKARRDDEEEAAKINWFGLVCLRRPLRPTLIHGAFTDERVIKGVRWEGERGNICLTMYSGSHAKSYASALRM